MSIQDISISNNQRKNLLKALPDDSILVVGDDGELIVSVADYAIYKKSIKKETKKEPIELIIGDDVLDLEAEFWVFS